MANTKTRKRPPYALALDGVIFEAALNDLSETLALALQQGGDGLAQDQFGNTALMSAAAYGHFECAQLLIPTSDPDCVNADGETALMWAVKNNNLDCARLLAPITDTSILCSQGASALYHAAVSGNPEMVELVLACADLALPLLIQGANGATVVELSKSMTNEHCRDIASLLEATALACFERKEISAIAKKPATSGRQKNTL